VNRKLVDLLITRTGAEVVHVGNGAEALELATKESFDLILMDIQMPVMNGRDATRAIREAGVNTPILALTANVMAEDLQDYREAGCDDDYLAKPIDKRRFYEALARYLTVRGETRAEANHQFQGTVLVAEDNEDNSRLVERLLRRYGVDVIKRGTGSEAVSTAMSETVHLILMDSHMPEMDGPEATRMLRQTGFRRPIIAFTAGDEAEVDELQKAGCTVFCTSRSTPASCRYCCRNTSVIGATVRLLKPPWTRISSTWWTSSWMDSRRGFRIWNRPFIMRTGWRCSARCTPDQGDGGCHGLSVDHRESR